LLAAWRLSPFYEPVRVVNLVRKPNQFCFRYPCHRQQPYRPHHVAATLFDMYNAQAYRVVATDTLTGQEPHSSMSYTPA
jgi:hypothetical protein